LSARHVEPRLYLRNSAINILADLVFGKRRIHQEIRCHLQTETGIFREQPEDGATRLIVTESAKLPPDSFYGLGNLLRRPANGARIENRADYRRKPSFFVSLEARPRPHDRVD